MTEPDDGDLTADDLTADDLTADDLTADDLTDGDEAPVGADDVGTDDVAEDAVPPTELEPAAPEPPRRRLVSLLVPALLVVLLLGSAGFASWAYLTQFRPDRQTNAAAAGDSVKAANDGAIALLSYAPETMDKDFATAKSHLTGEFLDYYSQFTQDIVTPAVKQKSVKTSAVVIQSAVSQLEPGSAVVLVFLNQTTTSKENPSGSFTASSVKVGLTKVNGTWLISAFDPV